MRGCWRELSRNYPIWNWISTSRRPASTWARSISASRPWTAARMNLDEEEAVPQISGPNVGRPGDLWLVNRHRVYCGNALDACAYESLMQGERAAMVFCDPPYNVKI